MFRLYVTSDLWQRSGQTWVEEAIWRRKWRWLGHTQQKCSCNITRQALTWNPQRKAKERSSMGHLEMFEAEVKFTDNSWYQLERGARTGQEVMERNCWRLMLLRRGEGQTQEQSSDFPEKTFRTLFFLETSLEKYWEPKKKLLRLLHRQVP